jgi:hypothetical protein
VGKPPTPKKPIAWVEIPCEGVIDLNLGSEEREKTRWGEIQAMREDRWRQLVLAYEEAPEDFWVAWHWLNEHPIFYRCHRDFHEKGLLENRGILDGCVEVIPAKVNPETRKRSEDETKNSKLEFWVEVFPRSLKPERDGISLHDYERDTGGDTYELAIVAVAKAIYAHHGNDRATLDKEWKQ